MLLNQRLLSAATGSASFAESLYGLRRVAVSDKDASGAARKPLGRSKMRLTLLLLVRHHLLAVSVLPTSQGAPAWWVLTATR